MRVQTTIAANANSPTTAPTPIPAFVPSVMFDMMVVELTAKSGPSQGKWGGHSLDRRCRWVDVILAGRILRRTDKIGCLMV